MMARKLLPCEYMYGNRIMAVCFQGKFDLEKEQEKAKTEKEDPHFDMYGAFETADAQPVSCVVATKFSARFDGHSIPLAGIGGVSTLPPYRRGGAISASMEVCHADLYRQGFVFSALYPFSNAYYRQFAYEPGNRYTLCTVALDDLKGLPPQGGKITELFPGDPTEPLLRVYNAACKNVNLSVLRDVFDKRLDEENYLNAGKSVFVWTDENGTPAACLIGQRSNGDTLDCAPDYAGTGLFFRDIQALYALLSFVRTAFAANYQTVRFALPGEMDILDLLPGARNGGTVQSSVCYNGMVRTIHVHKALELCRCEGEGSCVIRVQDAHIPENNGSFRLTFAEGQKNHVEKLSENSREADIQLNPGQLAQLLTGCKTADDLPYMPGVQTNRTGKVLQQVFRRKKCMLYNRF